MQLGLGYIAFCAVVYAVSCSQAKGMTRKKPCNCHELHAATIYPIEPTQKGELYLV